MYRAAIISTMPSATMPSSDQRWVGAASSDLANTQPRKMAAPSGSRPRIRKSQALLSIRRR